MAVEGSMVKKTKRKSKKRALNKPAGRRRRSVRVARRMVTPLKGSDISSSEYARLRDILKEFTRHVVCLCFFLYRRDLGKDLEKETRANFCSGFIMRLTGNGIGHRQVI